MASLADFLRGGFHVAGLGLLTVVGQVANDVLHHNHSAIDHHAEIESAQGKKIRRDMAQIEP